MNQLVEKLRSMADHSINEMGDAVSPENTVSWAAAEHIEELEKKLEVPRAAEVVQHCVKCENAAKTIEKLERYRRESKERIDILEDAIQRWRDTDGNQRLRIEALEKALREIADTRDSKDLGLDEPETNEDQNMIDTLIHIARRALEGKP